MVISATLISVKNELRIYGGRVNSDFILTPNVKNIEADSVEDIKEAVQSEVKKLSKNLKQTESILFTLLIYKDECAYTFISVSDYKELADFDADLDGLYSKEI